MTAAAWNALLASRRRNRLLDILPPAVVMWRHPWQLTPVWDPVGRVWTVMIRAGYVNGQCATVDIAAATAPALTLQRLQAAAKRSGLPVQQPSAGNVTARLYELPRLPLLSYRAIGSDADPTGATTDLDTGDITPSYDPVPPYFASLGVANPPDGTLLQQSDNAPTGPFRLLRAIDIVLHQPRMTSAVNLAADPDGSQSQTIAYGSTANEKLPSSIVTVPDYQAAQLTLSQSTLADLADGNFTDPGVDTLLLSTVYLLSPYNTPAGAAPDATWQPYLRHAVFYNLDHGVNPPPPYVPPQALEASTFGLAGGVAEPIVQGLVGQINTQDQASSAFLSAAVIQGLFYSV